MLQVPPDQPASLRIQAGDGATDLYPRLVVYDAAGSAVATLDASHLAGGLYAASWTPSAEGNYTMVGQFFADAGRTVDAGYDRVADDVLVTGVLDLVRRVLGLLHENSVIDSHVYDVGGRLTSARVRAYDSAAHAQAASGTGLLNTWNVAATYSSGQLESYTLTRS